MCGCKFSFFLSSNYQGRLLLIELVDSNKNKNNRRKVNFIFTVDFALIRNVNKTNLVGACDQSILTSCLLVSSMQS